MSEPLTKTVEKDLDAEALNCMAQGKRHLLIHDYNSAVQFFEEACKFLDSKYGISADECADAYFSYGSALLELHRQESGALDGLADSKAQEDEEDDEEEVEDEESKENDQKSTEKEDGKENEEDISVSPNPQVVQEQSTNGVSSSSSNDQLASSNGNNFISSTTNGNGIGSADLAKDQQSMETDVDPNQPSTSTGITDENRVEDEEATPSNSEVAFEVLTMAKAIYLRQSEYRENAFLKLSDALQKLGEILYEWENNEEALKELNECLEIRKRHLPDDDRLIAEAYYHIGLAHSLNSNMVEANSHFRKAVDVIEKRLNKLKTSYTAEPEGSENRVKIENEIKDLESVLPEMKDKIEENTQDQMSTSKLAAVVEEDEKAENEAFAKKKEQISAKPISNLTHLVKRKRESEPTEEEDSNKKLKNGNSSNGTASVDNVEMKED